MKKCLIFLFLGLIVINAYANDTFFTLTNGNLTPYYNSYSDIEMKSEIIVICLFDDYYTVEVTFNFYNNGNDQELLVGFPQLIEGVGGIGEISDFRTWVNNEIVQVDNVNRKFDWSVKQEIHNIYLKTVSFKENANTKTIVKYRSTYGGIAPSYKIASYLYGSGVSWDKNIGRIDVIIENRSIYKIDKINFQDDSLNNYEYKWLANDKIGRTIFEIEPEYYDTFQIYLDYMNYNDVIASLLWKDELKFQDKIRSYVCYMTRSQIKKFKDIIQEYDIENYKKYNMSNIVHGHDFYENPDELLIENRKRETYANIEEIVGNREEISSLNIFNSNLFYDQNSIINPYKITNVLLDPWIMEEREISDINNIINNFEMKIEEIGGYENYLSLSFIWITQKYSKLYDLDFREKEILYMMTRFYINLVYARDDHIFNSIRWNLLFKEYDWYTPSTKQHDFPDRIKNSLNKIIEIRSVLQ